MADNVTVRPSEGGVQVATDEVDGVHIPIFKLATGVDGEAEGISSDNPVSVEAITAETTLSQILEQLKLLNMQMSLLTDVTFNKGDRI